MQSPIRISAPVLLQYVPQATVYYLTDYVFPRCIRYNKTKLMASGMDLGSNLIFETRLGFSGTPSNLLPTALYPCKFQVGTQAKILDILLDPRVVALKRMVGSWDPTGVLQMFCRSGYNALIDTGALITGYTNHEVAKFVLKHDKEDVFDVAVFLDEKDRQVFITKANDLDPKSLRQCGTPLKRRFTLYDQRHTTGTDIKQAPNARALATLGKGITFRDHSQACWRMRGIAKGQCIDVLVVDEVVKLVTRELSTTLPQFASATNVTMEMVMTWMLRNNMLMESMQQIQLSNQAVSNLPRRIGFHELLRSDASHVTESSPRYNTPSEKDAAAILQAKLPAGDPLLLQSILAQRMDPPTIASITTWLSNPWEGPQEGQYETLHESAKSGGYETLLEAVLVASKLSNVGAITRNAKGMYTLRKPGSLKLVSGPEVSWTPRDCVHGQPLTLPLFQSFFDMFTRSTISSSNSELGPYASNNLKLKLDRRVFEYHDPSTEQTESRVKLESLHPYKPSTKESYVLEVPGATAMNVWFCEDTVTYPDYHWVRFMHHEGSKKFYGKMKYSGPKGDNWPKKNDPLRIPSGRCVVRFETDQYDLKWGWTITAEAAPDETGSNSRFNFPLEEEEVRALEKGFDRPSGSDDTVRYEFPALKNRSTGLDVVDGDGGGAKVTCSSLLPCASPRPCIAAFP